MEAFFSTTSKHAFCLLVAICVTCDLYFVLLYQLRIEYMEAWIDLLERHGFDPAAIETETTTRWMVKQRVPGETVN